MPKNWLSKRIDAHNKKYDELIKKSRYEQKRYTPAQLEAQLDPMNARDELVWEYDESEYRQGFIDKLERIEERKKRDADLSAWRRETHQKKLEREAESLRRSGWEFDYGRTLEGSNSNRWHVSPDGVSRRCNASSMNSCPYSSDRHFYASKETSQDEVQRIGFETDKFVTEKMNVTDVYVSEDNEAENPMSIISALRRQRTERDRMENGAIKFPERYLYEEMITVPSEWYLDDINRINRLPIVIRRGIGSESGQSSKDHAYWEVTMGAGRTKVVYRNDHIDPNEINEHVNTFCEQNIKPEYCSAIQDEITAKTISKAQFIEGLQRVYLHQCGLNTHNFVKIDDNCGILTPTENGLLGNFDVGYEPVIPVHILGLARMSDAANRRLAPGFTMRGNNMAPGLANWSLTKNYDGSWTGRVVGSRGESRAMIFNDKETAAEHMANMIHQSSSVTPPQRDIYYASRPESWLSEQQQDSEYFEYQIESIRGIIELDHALNEGSVLIDPENPRLKADEAEKSRQAAEGYRKYQEKLKAAEQNNK